jgi:hypothetical protein
VWLAADAGMVLFAGLATGAWLAPDATTAARVGLSVAAVLSVAFYSNMATVSLYGGTGTRRKARGHGSRLPSEWPERGLITQLVVWTLDLGAIALIGAWVVVVWQQESVGVAILCTVFGIVVAMIALMMALLVINPKDFYSGGGGSDGAW